MRQMTLIPLDIMRTKYKAMSCAGQIILVVAVCLFVVLMYYTMTTPVLQAYVYDGTTTNCNNNIVSTTDTHRRYAHVPRLNKQVLMHKVPKYTSSRRAEIFTRRHKPYPCPLGKYRKPPVVAIIGGTKCSTESLAVMMNLHPNLSVETDEANYFPLKTDPTIENYSAKMPCTTEYESPVDRSAEYLHQSTVIPQQMYDYYPHMRLILLVRDPTDRVISHFVFRRDSRHVISNTTSLEGYIMHANGSIRADKDIIESSLYYQHIMRWLSWFSSEQILVLPYEMVKYDPYNAMVQVERFLHLEHKVTEDMFVYNTNRGFFCYVMNNRDMCVNPRKGLPHEKMNHDTINRLREFYHPHNQRFYKLIGVDFEWEEPRRKR